MTKNQRTTLLRVFMLVFVVALTIVLVIYRNRVRELGVYGYPGIFLVSILANATIIIPVPGILITTAMGAVFNPFWVAIIAGAGSAIGELTGYIAGYGGQPIIENRDWYDRVTKWMKKYGDLTIFVLALIPNPLFDLAGMASGALKLPVWRFLLVCFFGKVLKMMIFAYVGASIMSFIS
jgi:membrane protein YqaA with SNARE-associated domain